MRVEEYERMFRMEGEHFWFVGTRRVIIDALARALGAPAPDARVLDLGCGTGYTLTQLPPGLRAVGIDASPEALRYSGRRATGATLVRGRAEELPFPDASFDAVLALDVLEHLDDDLAGAQEISRVLRPGGVAVVTVPAFRALWSDHDEALAHRRRYRLRELRAVLETAGLSIETLSYYNFWLLPVAAMVRVLGRAQPRREHWASLAVPPRPLNRMLAAIIASERRLLPRFRFPAGLSCIAVARRPPA